MSRTKRWEGLAMLVTDAVTHGASAVERAHLASSKRTFDVIELVPGVAEPAKVVHLIHDASAMSVYAAVRGVARVVSKAALLGLAMAPPARPTDDLSG
jgi:hypothetical protein